MSYCKWDRKIIVMFFSLHACLHCWHAKTFRGRLLLCHDLGERGSVTKPWLSQMFGHVDGARSPPPLPIRLYINILIVRSFLLTNTDFDIQGSYCNWSKGCTWHYILIVIKCRVSFLDRRFTLTHVLLWIPGPRVMPNGESIIKIWNCYSVTLVWI